MDLYGGGDKTVFALCVEASHARGMGHLFRAMNLASAIHEAGHSCIFFVNEHVPSTEILAQRGLAFEVVPLLDGKAVGWEVEAIRQKQISVWVDDRLDTDESHAQLIKSSGLPLVTFDDRGTGAVLADINIAALAFDPDEHLSGRTVLRGKDYLILNPEIRKYRRIRTRVDSIVVTLGGSDTFGVTVNIVQHLKDIGRTATVIVGPGFMHQDSLLDAANGGFEIKFGVPSLIAEFYQHDLAITGGGITPFEANASGLPCVIVANELFEIPVGKALAGFGGAVFAGFRESYDERILAATLPIEIMSRNGMDNIDLHGIDRVMERLCHL